MARVREVNPTALCFCVCEAESELAFASLFAIATDVAALTFSGLTSLLHLPPAGWLTCQVNPKKGVHSHSLLFL